MSPHFRLPGGRNDRRRTNDIPFRRPEPRFTTADLIADDLREHPVSLHEELACLERHDDEVRAQRLIDAMCAENSKPRGHVLSVLPADPTAHRKAA